MSFNWNNAQSGMGYGAGLGGLFGSLFGGGKNPFDAMTPYYNQIPGILQGNLGPYANAGTQMLPQLQGAYSEMFKYLPELQKQYGDLASNPGDVWSKLGKGFQESPGYQWNLGQGEAAINNAAAYGGMSGSPQHQQEAGQLATNMANQEFNNYMGNILGLYNQGLSGEQGLFNTGISGAQGLYNIGAGAGGNLAASLANVAASQANNAANRQNYSNQQHSGLWSGLGALAGLLGGFL